ncbi:MAG: hypothetical protein WCC64_22925 [Aliidongia sp.]
MQSAAIAAVTEGATAVRSPSVAAAATISPAVSVLASPGIATP